MVDTDGLSGGSMSEGSTGAGTTTSENADTTGLSTTDTGDDESPIPDVFGTPDFGTPEGACTVEDNGDAVVPCQQSAPPDAFDEDVQWAWEGDGDDTYVLGTPLVANLTDDDGNGSIDLCDTPDIIVIAFPPAVYVDLDGGGHIYVLDGATGEQLMRSEQEVHWGTTPALGDIDGDGLPEIVATGIDGIYPTPPLAFNHDLTPLEGFSATVANSLWAPAAIADLEGDGEPEIVIGNNIYDHMGGHLATLPGGQGFGSVPAIADLDENGTLEVILGNGAFTAQGGGAFEPYYDHTATMPVGTAQVADMTGDGSPEVVITNDNGITVLDSTGAPLVQDVQPFTIEGTNHPWRRSATIHDFNGDGQADFAFSAGETYAIHTLSGDPLGVEVLAQWTVLDASGAATGTAFDFLGDGSPEAIYADENFLWVFDVAEVEPVVKVPRSSRTGLEYPTVADVDNDGAAEIVVVSNENLEGEATAPAVQVIRDIEDRWIPTRRIWNQHAYHVTNVREDGTIPAVPAFHWQQLNTYRTNTQVEDGSICEPEG